MSHGPSDKRVPDAEWATQKVKDIILNAWQPDWTRPGHPKYEENNVLAEKVARMLRELEDPQVDQALAALEDEGYELIKTSEGKRGRESNKL